jgi:putative NADH-flavin reductase
MQLLVVGATGGTGKQAVEQALERGYSVTAFVRDPAKLGIQHPNLTVLTGDVLKPETLLPAVRRQDAVLCSLGSRPGLDGPGQQDHSVSEGTKNLMEAMKLAGVRRLLVVSSLGVGDSYAGAPILSKLFIKTFLSGPMAEKEIQEQAIRDSKLDWLIARPTRLVDGKATSNYKVAENMDFSVFNMPRINRADVAAFLLDQLTSDQYLHKTVTITDK